ncbi:MAG: nuclear transport factor 2 family protein [Acidimicrobiales bacterium]
MTDLSNSSRIQVAQRFLAYIGRPDFAEVLDVLAPKVIYRVVGRHALAGTFSGRDEVADHLADLAVRTKGTVDALQWEDWLLGQHHVAALGRFHMQAAGKTHVGHHIYLLTFDSHELISEVSVHFEDEGSIERFFGP